jgi:hypothetical protein
MLKEEVYAKTGNPLGVPAVQLEFRAAYGQVSQLRGMGFIGGNCILD